MLILQHPQVQTSIAAKVLSSLSEKLDGDITIEKIHLKPFTTLVLKNTLIIDREPAVDPTDSTLSQVDTFFRAEYIIAKFSLEGLLHPESIRIKSAYVGNAQMNLVLEDLVTKNDSIVQYDNLSRIFNIEKDKEKKEPSPDEIFMIRDVEISDMGFRLLNRGSKKTPYYGGINWNDLDIRSINLSAKGLRFKDGIMYGEAESLSFKEKTGFTSRSMSGKTRVGRGKTIVEDLRLKDTWSDIDIPLFMMSYDSVDDFKDFIEKVRLDAEIATSLVNFKTITHFAPQLEDNSLIATVSGTMSGFIDDFTVKDISLSSHSGGFCCVADARISGIPDVNKMRIDADVTINEMTPDGLGRFVSEWIPGGALDLSRFADGGTFKGTASSRGLINNLRVRTDLSAETGRLKASAKLNDIIRQDRPICITGNVSTDRLDIGRLAGIAILGQASLDTDISLKLGRAIAVDLENLNIKGLVLNGYEYTDILAKGRYDSSSLNGTVISKDPNLNFIFQGGYAKSDKSQNTVYKFDASIGHADLNAINIDKRGKSFVQLRTNANFTKTGNGNLLGRIDVGEILLENKSGRYDIGDIVVTSRSMNDKYYSRLNSSFAEGNFTGTSSIIDFFKDIHHIAVMNELPALAADNKHEWKGDSYSLNFTCHDVQNVLAFAAPGLYIEKGTSIKAAMNKAGNLKADINSGRIAYKRNYMKGLSLNFDNSENSLNGTLRCDEISASRISMMDNILQLHVNDNSFGAGFSFDNHNDTDTRGELIINGNIDREEDQTIFNIGIRPSSILYGSKEWNIQPSKIRIEGGDIEIDTFGVVSGDQSVGLFGKMSSDTEEILTLNLERFDLSLLNDLLPSYYGVKGAVTGTAQLTSPVDDMELMIDILCDSTYIADIPVGVVKMNTTWDDVSERFNVYLSNTLSGERNFDISGQFSPKNGKIHADVLLNKLNVGYAQPLLNEIFSSMKGYINGMFCFEGKGKNLSLTSKDAVIDDGELTIAYTGVPYKVAGPFHIVKDGIYFDDINIKDRYDGIGIVSGGILHNNFKDIRFDTRIRVNRIEAVNLNEKQGETFYGRLYGSGDIHITGPVNSLVMDINAETAKAGELHIPISSSVTSQKGTNLLRFKEIDTPQEEDPYEIFVQKADKEETSASDFLLKLKVNAHPDVEAFVEIDKASGNVLTGRGSGNISLNVSEDIFNINGDYTLSSGNYKFVAMGLVGRDFTIQDGSSIRFNGDIMESTLDINAIYRTKASISSLISDTTSVTNRRIVDCGISIKDKLSNPQLEFSIDIPDLDPTVKSRVESALSTEDKIQKQFLSLIISNNFLPDEQSGVVNNSSVLYSNVTELMANQINNILQKLDIPLDLGLNYQPNEKGNDIFDVAVSTHLFNNRVIVNGNIGNRQYSSGNTQNDVVGDIDIEIKLDRSGSFRLNLFSHSADQYTNYLDNSQRNGVGITYQTEFNSFRQFFRNLFSSRARRAENRRVEEEQAIREDRVELIIKPVKQQ